METPWQMTCWRKICSFKRRSWENDCSEAAIFKLWVLWELKHQNTSSPFFFKFVCSVSTDRWRPPLRFMRLESNRLRRVSDGVWKTLRNIKDSDSQRAEYGSLSKVRKVNVYIYVFSGENFVAATGSASKGIIQLTVRGVLVEIKLWGVVVDVRTVSVCGGEDRRWYGSAVRTYREEQSLSSSR